MKIISILRRCIIALVLLLPILAKSQTIYYSYDNAGNRISKSAILLKSATDNNSESEKAINPNEYTENIGLCEITIFPNPTDGQLKVRILDLPTYDEASISVYSLNGTKIFYLDHITGENIVDISNHPNGVYLMRIVIGSQLSEWKIIKE